MIIIPKERLNQLFENFRGKKILVLGDLMLDRYLWGSVTRISPEAPVPVVEIESESSRLGGAANVAHNVFTLGVQPIPVGVVGNDHSGRILIRKMKQANFPTEGVIVDDSRPTTVKTRVIAHNQHVVRTDRESRADIDSQTQDKIIQILKQFINQIDAIIIQDYNKGLIVSEIIKEVIALAHSHGKIITVDPKFQHFFEFKGVTLFKPNKKETEEALRTRLRDDEELKRAGFELLKVLNCLSVLITLGEKGMILFQKEGEVTRVPTKARKVHDVSGAGDTVISTITVALAAGADMKEAATLANYAAGIVCGEVGIVPIDKRKLIKTVIEDYSSPVHTTIN